MKNITGWLLAGTFFVTTLFWGSTAAADNDLITVLNPRGFQPPIRLLPLAPRLDTLEGKTIYIVDIRYQRTREFVEELHKLLKEKHPKTNWILRNKSGAYATDDPKLWAEIKENGHGMIITTGH